MKQTLRDLTLGYGSGAFGGLVYALVLWAFDAFQVPAKFEITQTPLPTTLTWLYPHLIYWGCWGFLFALPFKRSSYLFRGIIYSLIPAALHLFVLLPFRDHYGFMGTDLGQWMPLLVLTYCLTWGISSALWLKTVKS